MRTFDFSPLFRSTVGFDRVSHLLDSALRQSDDALNGFPPYNIEKLGDDSYRIVMAVAGFSEDDLEIVSADNVLTVRGKANKEEGEQPTFLHRGIAGRAFERRFQLADHIKVSAADLKNGLLEIELVREVPEVLRPRTIAIGKGTPQAQPQEAIEARAA
jgi:molecular chaperone IbpA